MPRPLLTIGLALALGTCVVATTGCGGKTTGKVVYSVSAQRNYEKGLKELETHDWIAAAKYFAFIKSRFPYSKYAVLAEIRLADAEFGAGQYLEAVDSYKLFQKFHPTHELVINGYAAFRVGECYYKMLPGDFWILPPSHEKDQSSAEDAEEEIRKFLEKYPDSPHLKRGKEILARVGKRLAAHEWYVARYYWDRDKPMGTVLRLRRLIERYAGVGYDEEAMWLLGRAYLAVGMPDRARTTWQDLVDKFPKHARASDARGAIGRLPPPSTKPAPKAEPAKPDPVPATPPN
jgi:outer membrane protein assembly factor BamD